MTTNNHWLIRAFSDVLKHYDINSTTVRVNGMEFTQDDLFRVLDLFALMFNGQQIYDSRYVRAYRYARLDASCHLLSMFIMLDYKYQIKLRFTDDASRVVLEDTEGSNNFMRDMLRLHTEMEEGAY